MDPIIAAIITASAVLMAALIPLLYKYLKSQNSIKVKRIVSEHDPDLLKALELYNHSISNNERDDPESIVRWLQEVQTETKEGRCKLQDYFLVAKLKKRVCGILYAHYYSQRQLIFISYMAVDENVQEARGSVASKALVQYLSDEIDKRLIDCEGIVFELEHPEEAKTPDQKLTSRARIKGFRALARTMNIVVKQIKIDYYQPRLSLWENGYKEERLVLMYGRTHPPHILSTISCNELMKVLNFLYSDIYGDHFEDDRTKDTTYRQYLIELYKTTIKNMPENVPVL